MAKMIRCPAGHVYDKEAHDSCPKCARADQQQADEAQVSPGKAEDEQDQRRSLPLPWLASGGVAVIALIGIAIFLLRPAAQPQPTKPIETASQSQGSSTNANDGSASTPIPTNSGGAAPASATSPAPTSQASGDPKSDPDYQACDTASGGEAITVCAKAIASGKFTGSDLAVLYDYRGLAEAKSAPDDAIQDYSKAIDLDTNFAAAFNDRGIAYSAKNDNDRAKADFDRSIQLDPNDLNAYWNRGDLDRSKGDRESAAADYRKALSLNPDDADKKEIEAALNGLGAELQAQPTKPSEPESQSPRSNTTANDASAPTPVPSAANSTPASATSTAPSAQAMSDPSYRACTKLHGQAGIKTCSSAIEMDEFAGSDLAFLYNYRGSAEADSNPDQALEDYNKAIDLDPNLALAFSGRGFLYYERNDPDHALQDFNRAIELDPNVALAFNGRGLLFYDRKDYDLALQDFNRAIELDPKNEAIFNNRGITYLAKKDNDHAKADFDRAIELNADDRDAYWNRGDVYRSKGDRESATADYRKALSLNPSDADKKEIEASLNGLDAKAPAAPEQQGSIAPDATPANGEPNGASGSGGSAQPADDISHGDGAASASNPDPDYQACRNTSGDDAIAACDRVIASGRFGDPELALAYNRRGYMYGAKEDFRRDLADQNKAIELDPGFSRAYSDRGAVYFAKRDYRRAIADFNKSIQVDPKFSLAYSNRGAAYQRRKDYDQAMADYNEALALNPNLALAYYNRGTVYEAMGRRYDAISDYRRALAKDPNDQDIKDSLKKLGASESAATTTNGSPAETGTEIVKNADGSSVETRSDGTKIITNADGSSVEARPDGTKIIKNTDGSVIQVNPDGSKVLLHK
jgi:tetratricopeptide (TPR) repeat protein